jgi:PST family polysaccharide transporter
MKRETYLLIKLGVAIMLGSLMTAGTMYILRVMIIRELGLEATGLYQAAGTLSSVYVGFILESMGKDFYPRLSSVAHDNALCNKLVNEQAEVSFLLAAPGICATLILAPLVITILYSEQFVNALEILRWQMLGILLRVGSWPMGFILLAKGEGKKFFLSEFITNIVYIGLTWVGILYLGLKGVGVAFFGMYLFYWILIYIITKKITGLTWSKNNLQIGLVILPAVGIVFLGANYFSEGNFVYIGAVITMGVFIFSMVLLSRMAKLFEFPDILTKFKNLCLHRRV